MSEEEYENYLNNIEEVSSEFETYDELFLN